LDVAGFTALEETAERADLPLVDAVDRMYPGTEAIALYCGFEGSAQQSLQKTANGHERASLCSHSEHAQTGQIRNEQPHTRSFRSVNMAECHLVC
jgi:hypothetical protein